MSNTNTVSRNVVDAGARWFGFVLALSLAVISWYCLLNEVRGGAAAAAAALLLLLFSMFRPDFLAVPARLMLIAGIRAAGFFRIMALAAYYCVVLCPLEMAAGIFNKRRYPLVQVVRSRKYKLKSPGSYWELACKKSGDGGKQR